MLVEQFFEPGLGHASYLVADTEAGVAFLVDPERDIEQYLAAAARYDVLITHAFETHIHNDYVSGSHALATLRPITVVTSTTAEVEYAHLSLADGASVKVGEMRVRALATPGHTPEHVAWLVADLRRTDEAQWLFSGGALLVDNIARVDLLGPDMEERLARDAYVTLRERILALPDHLAVFPTHGAGSACSGGVEGSRFTTLGFERRHNRAVFSAAKDFAAFHASISADLPVPPSYYPQVRALNSRGASIAQHSPLAYLAEAQLHEPGLTTVDPRPPAIFGAGHRKGTLNVVGNDSFASRVGAVVPFGTPLALLADDGEQAARLRDRLLVIGYDDVRGWAPSLPKEGLDLVALDQLDPRTSTPARGEILLDVREPAEWRAGHAPGAVFIPLAALREKMTTLPRDGAIVTYCSSGVRSSLAASMLQAAGYEVRNLRGGFAAWQAAGLPVESETA